MELGIEDVLRFWFEDLTPQNHFEKNEELDFLIRDRFFVALEKTVLGEYPHWRASAEGALAQVILLDQFSRNIFRNNSRSFAQDPLALAVAQDAIVRGFDKKLKVSEKGFLYMPFMHSESLKVHETAVELFSQPGLELSLDYEIRHKRIIERFGRYPHRNKILGRESTAEELEFLKGPDSSF